MMTPQEVSQHAFSKASFGGYNMAMVDEFLDALTEDYTTLYKENAVLKSKMKVLVDKVEEYRSTEDGMRKALLAAQKTADEIVTEAEARRVELVRTAEAEARAKIEGLRGELEREQYRLASAQSATAAYVGKLKELYQHEIEYLGSISRLTAPEPCPVEQAAREIDASMQRLAEEEAPADQEDTLELEELEQLRTAVAETEGLQGDGGLYAELLELNLDHKGREEPKKKEHRAARRYEEEDEAEDEAMDEPTQRIDLNHLKFGKDYEIK